MGRVSAAYKAASRDCKLPKLYIFSYVRNPSLQSLECRALCIRRLFPGSPRQFQIYTKQGQQPALVCLPPSLLQHCCPHIANRSCLRYHFYYLPKREQSYQLLQMTIGMCVDLGLALKPVEAMARKVGLRMSHYRKADHPSAEHDAFYSREARRAYLGCYYLSTTTAWVTGKPSNLHV